MTRRERVIAALEHRKTDIVPWDIDFTIQAKQKLCNYYGTGDLDSIIKNHFLHGSQPEGFYTQLEENIWIDRFGVKWDRSVEKDIGIPIEHPIKSPTLKGYEFPNPLDPENYKMLEESLENPEDRFVRFNIGFSLFEAAWTTCGLENIYIYMMDNPNFVHELLDAICDIRLQMVKHVINNYPQVDGFYFGDDWGQQSGLLMGYKLWKTFVYPRIKRMYAVVREADKYVFIHSCGKVQEVFDDLIDIGLQCFNPFQPEVMDVYEMKKKYRGRLAFHGGLGTQSILPHGTSEQVKEETKRLLKEIGEGGGYIFAPSHAVPKDVPVENMAAMLDVLLFQGR